MLLNLKDFLISCMKMLRMKKTKKLKLSEVRLP
jgi:hypothetical protein